MKIKVNYGEKVNMGNYETKHIELSIEVELMDSADYTKEYKSYFMYLRNLVKEMKGFQ